MTRSLRFLPAVLLVLAILAAGCTGTPPPAPPPVNPVLPGQEVQLVGNVTGEGFVTQGIPHGTLDSIRFTIGLTPGTKVVNLANLTIIYADAVKTESLIPVEGYRGVPPKGSWGVISVANELGKPNDRIEYEEQPTIEINPKAAIVPNQVITIVIKPPSGPALTIRRVIPSTIYPGENALSPV